MTISDYVLDIALVLLVLLQIKERPVTNRDLIRPLIIVSVAVVLYADGLPTTGNDLVLLAALAITGATIGLASGFAARMRVAADGAVVGRSGWLSGFFWVLGMGSRFAFVVWITHSGAGSIAHFSADHAISGDAWTTALLAMAVGEVLGRTGVMAYRRSMLRAGAPPALTTAG
jgi:hypothetical protein